MLEIRDDLRVILIGGSSHCGKSTLGEELASRLGWTYRSTDKGFARHPGRPWPTPTWTVPPHVIDYYASHDQDFLLADVVRHYRQTIWPMASELIRAHTEVDAQTCLVLEGSALVPDRVATLDNPRVAALYLTTNRDTFRRRMYASSDYADHDAHGRALIDTFLQRTWNFDAWMRDEVDRLGLPLLHVTSAETIESLMARVCDKLTPVPREDAP